MNLENVMLIIGVVVAVILFLGAKSKNELKVMSYQLMLVAKDKAKDGILKSGKEQKEWVISKIEKNCPKIIIKIFGQNNVSKMIETLYVGALDLIDDGQLNNSQ